MPPVAIARQRRPGLPFLGRVASAPGPATFDPTRDSAYDALVLADLPAYGSYWKFNETSGLLLADRGPLGLTATLSSLGSLGLNAYPGPFPGEYPNTSVRFTSPNTKAQISTDDYAFPGTSPFSVEMWVNPLSHGSPGGNAGYLMAHGTPVGGGAERSGWRLNVGTNGIVTMQRFQNDGTADTLSTALKLALYFWAHIVVTYDGASLRTYINGALVAGPTASTKIIDANSPGTLTIGNFSQPFNQTLAFDGYIARPAIYSSALTAAQVLTHFQAGVATSWSPGPLPRPKFLLAGPRMVLVGRARTDYQVPAGGGTTTLSLGLALETDTATPMTREKLRTLGLATETDTTLALAALKIRTLGIASETDTALALVREKLRSLGIVSETDAAQPFLREKLRSLGIATETDAALALARLKQRTLGVVSETDAAQVFSRLKQRTLGIATETDLALALPHAGAAVVRKLKMLMGMGR